MTKLHERRKPLLSGKRVKQKKQKLICSEQPIAVVEGVLIDKIIEDTAVVAHNVVSAAEVRVKRIYGITVVSFGPASVEFVERHM